MEGGTERPPDGEQQKEHTLSQLHPSHPLQVGGGGRGEGVEGVGERVTTEHMQQPSTCTQAVDE